MLRRLLAALLIAFLAVPAMATPHEARHQSAHEAMMTMAHAGHDQHRQHQRIPDAKNHLCIGCAASYGIDMALPSPMLPPLAVRLAPLATTLVPHGLAPETPPPRA